MKKILKNWNYKEHMVFLIVLVCMAVYYAGQMFLNKPWYDELYTYYSFICRGPIYAAIHWPVPNNHVFYSVLSAFLDYFGNPYIGLRGISYLASLCNMVLIYKLATKFMNRYLSVVSVLIYISTYLVNSLSIQGRGYAFSSTCYLTAVLCLYFICCETEKKRYYIIYAISLTAGLYTLISSTYWVISICFAGGLFLLIRKDYKKMFRLIFASLCAAAMTFFLYTLIWLAIGSNLLSKDATSIYYGVYQVTIILKDPFKAFMTGVNYMLSTPYIQSIERTRVIQELFSYLSSLFNLYFNGIGKGITVFCGLFLIVGFVYLIRNFKKKSKNLFLLLYLEVTVIMVPVMLIIQSVQPYKRVFSFFAAPFSLLIAYCLFLAEKLCVAEKLQTKINAVIIVFMITFSAVFLLSPSYRAPLAERENRIQEMFSGEDEITSIYYTDDFQKYVLKFYFDCEPQEVPLEQAEYVLVATDILNPEYTQAVWPVFLNHESFDYDYITSNFSKQKESDSYILYKRK